MKTKKTFLYLALGVWLVSAAAITASAKEDGFQGTIPLKGKSKSEYAALAQITLQDAIAIATKSTSGKVTEAALDKEDGFLVYEIEVQMSDQTRKEVLIDAGDGKILLVKDEKKKSSWFGDDDGDDD